MILYRKYTGCVRITLASTPSQACLGFLVLAGYLNALASVVAGFRTPEIHITGPK